MDAIAIQPPLTTADIHIVRDADWRAGIPQILETHDPETPLNLSGKTLELWVLPRFPHETLLRRLTSAGGGAEIVFDDAAQGLASIIMPRATVRAAFPIGRWRHFLLLIDGGAIFEVLRGTMFVHAGNTDAT